MTARTSQEPAGSAIEAALVPTYPGGIASPCGPVLADRWTMTIDALLGRPWPLPAPLPGRIHACADSPLTDAEREELLRDDSATDTEVARVLCLSRQRVGQLRRALNGCRETPENPAV